ncbi:TPA: DUF4430 domain-containing protein [Bacillus pseudomycoides]|nr:DUF4430 domain-containing protein [Bacillus pseudomycoides]
MSMMKWLVLLVFSFSFITGCSQNEVKTDAKVAGKQIEKKEEKKQEEKKQEGQKQEDSKQEQKPAEEQKQEEKQKEEKNADSKSIEQNQPQTKAVGSSQNQQEQSKVVNEPKEAPKQEDTEHVPAPVPPPPPPVPEVKMVTLSVIDDQGTILGETEVELQDGDTVFKVLGRTLKKKGIQMDYTGSGSGVYVQGINNLYEKSKGAGSGWMYRVNGVAVNKGAGSYKVKQGDKIEWFYSLDYRKEER